MILITEKPDGTREVSIGRDEPTLHVVMEGLATARAFRRAHLNPLKRTDSNAPEPRYVKLDADERPLPADAKGHAYVLDRRFGIIQPVQYADNGQEVDHDKALEFAAACRFGGRTDWRLYDSDELIGQAKHDRHDPAIDQDLFPGATSQWVWTRTPCAWRPAGSAFLCVGFGGGGVNGYDRSGQARVRVCRSALPAGQ
jgi:hypothetical protein